jgi:hypothetical protein
MQQAGAVEDRRDGASRRPFGAIVRVHFSLLAIQGFESLNVPFPEVVTIDNGVGQNARTAHDGPPRHLAGDLFHQFALHPTKSRISHVGEARVIVAFTRLGRVEPAHGSNRDAAPGRYARALRSNASR